MGPRRIIILLLALIVAGVTAIYARTWVNNQQRPVTVIAAPQPKADVTEVLVAEIDIPAGRFIKAQNLRWQAWPNDEVPDNYLVKGSGADKKAVVGSVVRRGLVAGQPITDATVVKPGDRGFLAAVLSPGQRAVSVPINATSGNAGLIFPGDRVDLILTQTLEAADGDVARRVSETVLSDIRVIAMGVEISDQAKDGKNHEKARTATIEVTPRQAESVALVTELGKLSLSLRSLALEDTGEVVTPEQLATPTWDKDVSKVLGSGNLPTSRLLVLRGSDTENVQIEGSN